MSNHVNKSSLSQCVCAALAALVRGAAEARASRPGMPLPSTNSRLAPPPVEMCDTQEARPIWLTAATLSPPARGRHEGTGCAYTQMCVHVRAYVSMCAHLR